MVLESRAVTLALPHDMTKWKQGSTLCPPFAYKKRMPVVLVCCAGVAMYRWELGVLSLSHVLLSSFFNFCYNTAKSPRPNWCTPRAVLVKFCTRSQWHIKLLPNFLLIWYIQVRLRNFHISQQWATLNTATKQWQFFMTRCAGMFKHRHCCSVNSNLVAIFLDSTVGDEC